MEMDGVRGKAAFAKRLGLSPSTYDNYENDRAVPVEVLVRISDVTGVDLRWLVTGRFPEEAVPASHLVVQRAAAMLSRYPQAAEPLAAFVELLSAAMAFPKKGPLGQSADGVQPVVEGQHAYSVHGAVAGQPMEIPVSAAPEVEVAASSYTASSSVVSAVAEIQEAFRAKVAQSPVASDVRAPGNAAIASPPPSLPISTAAASEARGRPPETPGRQAWIPVLGRSAAGVASFWGDQDSTGVARLADAIARHVGDVQCQQARVELSDGASMSPADPADGLQLVRLVLGDGAAGVTEFIESPSLKARYADAFALRIDGLSMHPDISHGDLVVLSPSAEAVDGKAAVVQLVDQIGVTCKLWRREGEQVHLIPVNDQMPPQTYPISSVVWAFRVLAKIKPA